MLTLTYWGHFILFPFPERGRHSCSYWGFSSCLHRRSLEIKEMKEWCGVCSFWIDFETLNTSHASSGSSDQSPQGVGEEYSLCSMLARRDSRARCEWKDQEIMLSWWTPVAEATSLRAGMQQNLHEEEEHMLSCSWAFVRHIPDPSEVTEGVLRYQLRSTLYSCEMNLRAIVISAFMLKWSKLFPENFHII